MGQLGVTQGHRQCHQPFDRTHTTSYSTLTETMRLSCTTFLRYSVTMTLKWLKWDRDVPACQVYRSKVISFESRRPNGRLLYLDRKWSVINRHYNSELFVEEHRLWQTDRQMQTHTQGRSIYRASIASRGKKYKKFKMEKKRESGRRHIPIRRSVLVKVNQNHCECSN